MGRRVGWWGALVHREKGKQKLPVFGVSVIQFQSWKRWVFRDFLNFCCLVGLDLFNL